MFSQRPDESQTEPTVALFSSVKYLALRACNLETDTLKLGMREYLNLGYRTLYPTFNRFFECRTDCGD